MYKRQFQSGVNEIVREAELEDARKAAQSLSKGSISKAIERTVDPKGDLKATVSGLQNEVRSASQISPVGPIPPAPPVAAAASTPSIAAPTTQTATSETESGDNAPAKEQAKA